MEWRQTLLVAVTTYAVTKSVDHLISISKYKYDFKKHRLEKIYLEIEELKDEIGRLYELSANWKAYAVKADEYEKALANDDYLIGKYNKYPDIVAAARDTLHFCKIVAYDEKESQPDVNKAKEELAVKYKEFIRICEAYIEKLI